MKKSNKKSSLHDRMKKSYESKDSGSGNHVEPNQKHES